MTPAEKIIAGGGMAALDFNEWLEFMFASRDENDLVIAADAAEMGLTPRELLAASDRITVFVEAEIDPHREIAQLRGYIVEIADAA